MPGTQGKRERYASVIRLLPDRREQYLELHSAVWPSVEATITACNIRNYTIWLNGDLLFGYYEYVGEDHDADQATMAADPETQRWWRLTDPCQERLPGTPEGQQWTRLPEVWHLD
jgi:L-rhamnose mutarotase